MRKCMLIRHQIILACALACGAALVALGESGQSKGAPSTVSAPTAPGLLAPCEVSGAAEGAKEQALCGAYEVFENRATKSGRRIKLKIVVFPATGREKAADPLFYI